MPDWFVDFLTGISMNAANDIWNSSMSVICSLISSTPSQFSSGTWAFVSNTMYPWAMSVGVSMLNLFFIIAIWQAVKNLHQNITLEMTIEALIKIVSANVLFLNLKNIMTLLFSAASAMVGDVVQMEAPTLTTEDIDIGSVLFYQLFGIFFIIVAIVCSYILLTTVYGRYIKLYLLVIMAPFALPTLVGGHGVEGTFYAWMRTFLLNTFEIVVIALVLVISWKMSSAGISIFEGTGMVSQVLDGFWDALNSLFTMILMTASVKSANSLFSKAFRL